MESQQLHNFNERLNQWVASQGFWFQLRYSMSGGGSQSALFHLVQLGVRLLIFLLVLGVLGWVYLVKRLDSQSYRFEVENRISKLIGATETKMQGFKRSGGQLNVAGFSGKGGEDAFFDRFEANGIKCDMGVLDGFSGKWETGTMTMARLDLNLRAGADDEAGAGKIGRAVFRNYGRVDVSSLKITDLTMRWGFSDQTKGSVEGTEARFLRMPEGWRVEMRGGYFSQNWLRRLQIEKLTAMCTPEGVVFEEAVFRRGEGTLDLTGLRIKAGARPMLEGVARMKSLPTDAILPPPARALVEGALSGEPVVSGSLNTPQGVALEGVFELGEGDFLTLRDRVPLLKALSVVDVFNSYRRVEFKEGSFKLKAGGAKLELSQVDLKAGDLFTLEGRLEARLPTADEAREAVAGGGAENFDLTVRYDADENADFSLKRAGGISRGEGGDDAGGELRDRMGAHWERRRIEEAAAERILATMRYEGEFRITLRGDAFERGEFLKKMYPVEEETGRIPLRVPLEGSIYELTLKQAAEIYENGRR